jgi:large repetitive protein
MAARDQARRLAGHRPQELQTDKRSSALTTTLSVANGTLNAGPGVTGNGTASVTIAGTAAQINAALAG